MGVLKNACLLFIAVMVFVSITVVVQLFRRQNKLLHQRKLQVDSLQIQLHQLEITYGASLFKMHCTPCHDAAMKTDNLLEGIVDRLGEKYLRLYLTRQDSLMLAKDKYAVQIKSAYHNRENSHNFKFSSKELDAIIAYLK